MSSPSPALPPATPSRPSSPAGGFRRSRRRRRGAGGTHDRAVPSPLPTREGPAAPGGRRVRRGGERVCGRTAKPRRLHPFGLREEETPNPKSWSGRTKKKSERLQVPAGGARGAGLRAPARTAHAPTRPPLLPLPRWSAPALQSAAAAGGAGRAQRALPARWPGRQARRAVSGDSGGDSDSGGRSGPRAPASRPRRAAEPPRIPALTAELRAQ